MLATIRQKGKRSTSLRVVPPPWYAFPEVRMETPVITLVPGSGEWTLVHPFRTVVGAHEVEVPAGFRFDMASVPRILWWLVAPFHLSIAAPLVHDWLYRRRGCVGTGPGGCLRVMRRRDADRVFRNLMRANGVHPVLVVTAWVAVRLFGWMIWRRYKIHDAIGEPDAVCPGTPPTSSGQGEIPDRR